MIKDIFFYVKYQLVIIALMIHGAYTIFVEKQNPLAG